MKKNNLRYIYLFLCSLMVLSSTSIAYANWAYTSEEIEREIQDELDELNDSDIEKFIRDEYRVRVDVALKEKVDEIVENEVSNILQNLPNIEKEEIDYGNSLILDNKYRFNTVKKSFPYSKFYELKSDDFRLFYLDEGVDVNNNTYREAGLVLNNKEFNLYDRSLAYRDLSEKALRVNQYLLAYREEDGVNGILYGNYDRSNVVFVSTDEFTKMADLDGAVLLNVLDRANIDLSFSENIEDVDVVFNQQKPTFEVAYDDYRFNADNSLKKQVDRFIENDAEALIDEYVDIQEVESNGFTRKKISLKNGWGSANYSDFEDNVVSSEVLSLNLNGQGVYITNRKLLGNVVQKIRYEDYVLSYYDLGDYKELKFTDYDNSIEHYIDNIDQIVNLEANAINNVLVRYGVNVDDVDKILELDEDTIKNALREEGVKVDLEDYVNINEAEVGDTVKKTFTTKDGKTSVDYYKEKKSNSSFESLVGEINEEVAFVSEKKFDGGESQSIGYKNFVLSYEDYRKRHGLSYIDYNAFNNIFISAKELEDIFNFNEDVFFDVLDREGVDLSFQKIVNEKDGSYIGFDQETREFITNNDTYKNLNKDNIERELEKIDGLPEIVRNDIEGGEEIFIGDKYKVIDVDNKEGSTFSVDNGRDLFYYNESKNTVGSEKSAGAHYQGNRYYVYHNKINGQTSSGVHVNDYELFYGDKEGQRGLFFDNNGDLRFLSEEEIKGISNVNDVFDILDREEVDITFSKRFNDNTFLSFNQERRLLRGKYGNIDLAVNFEDFTQSVLQIKKNNLDLSVRPRADLHSVNLDRAQFLNSYYKLDLDNTYFNVNGVEKIAGFYTQDDTLIAEVVGDDYDYSFENLQDVYDDIRKDGLSNDERDSLIRDTVKEVRINPREISKNERLVFADRRFNSLLGFLAVDVPIVVLSDEEVVKIANAESSEEQIYVFLENSAQNDLQTEVLNRERSLWYELGSSILEEGKTQTDALSMVQNYDAARVNFSSSVGVSHAQAFNGALGGTSYGIQKGYLDIDLPIFGRYSRTALNFSSVAERYYLSSQDDIYDAGSFGLSYDALMYAYRVPEDYSLSVVDNKRDIYTVNSYNKSLLSYEINHDPEDQLGVVIPGALFGFNARDNEGDWFASVRVLPYVPLELEPESLDIKFSQAQSGEGSSFYDQIEYATDIRSGFKSRFFNRDVSMELGKDVNDELFLAPSFQMTKHLGLNYEVSGLAADQIHFERYGFDVEALGYNSEMFYEENYLNQTHTFGSILRRKIKDNTYSLSGTISYWENAGVDEIYEQAFAFGLSLKDHTQWISAFIMNDVNNTTELRQSVQHHFGSLKDSTVALEAGVIDDQAEINGDLLMWLRFRF